MTFRPEAVRVLSLFVGDGGSDIFWVLRNICPEKLWECYLVHNGFIFGVADEKV